MPFEPLTFTATLVGKAATPSEHGLQMITLKVVNQSLYLMLTPEQAQMFPDLVQTSSHPTERKQQIITYSPGPSYSVVISEIAETEPEIPEPAPKEEDEEEESQEAVNG